MIRRATRNPVLLRRLYTNKPPRKPTDVDDYGFPLEPTWSVEGLLTSYEGDAPLKLDDASLERLHTLSALVPPKVGSEERAKLQRELEELMKLVNAVRVAPVATNTTTEGIPDGRIYPTATVFRLKDVEGEREVEELDETNGLVLLKHRQADQKRYEIPNLGQRRSA